MYEMFTNAPDITKEEEKRKERQKKRALKNIA